MFWNIRVNSEEVNKLSRSLCKEVFVSAFLVCLLSIQLQRADGWKEVLWRLLATVKIISRLWRLCSYIQVWAIRPLEKECSLNLSFNIFVTQNFKIWNFLFSQCIYETGKLSFIYHYSLLIKTRLSQEYASQSSLN